MKPDISWSNKKNEKSKGKYMTVSSSDVEMTAISSSDLKEKNEENYATVDVTIESAAVDDTVDESVSELKATTTETTSTTSLEGLTLSQTTRTAMFWAIALQPASIFWSGMNYHISDHVSHLAGLMLRKVQQQCTYLSHCVATFLVSLCISCGQIEC